MSIPPIPEICVPIVEAIRKEVPKPNRKDWYYMGVWRTRISRDGRNCCPMGLLPHAKPAPEFVKDMPPGLMLADNQVSDFADWFDSIGPDPADLQEAFDMIWKEDK